MNSIKMALAILVCSMLTLPASADAISGGKVTSVNADGTKFTYVKKRKHWTFRITDKTVFRVGEKTGNLSDLKTGQPVKVEFQRRDAAFTALLIGIGF
jgi:Cu/Ag efflux protein CusF